MSRTNPSGPRGHWLLGSGPAVRRDAMQFIIGLAKYGDVSLCRFGPFRVYMLNSPDLIQEFLVASRDKIIKSPQDAKILGRFLGRGLLTNEGENHKQQRKLVQPAFHMQRIRGYADVMVGYTQAMLERWQSGDVRDIDHEMMRLTLNIVTKTLFNAGVTEAEAEIVSEALDRLQADTNRLSQFVLRPPAWLPVPINRRIKAAGAAIDVIVRRVIAERRASKTDAGDLLSMLLLTQDENGGQGMTDQQVRDEVMTLFLAGHETTANTLTWTFYLLSQHRTAMQRLQAELDSVLNGRAPTLADLPQLRWNEMVLKESMRLYPPAWMLGPRLVREPIKLGELTLPKHATVLISPYTLHHDARFWPDPERFDPERFSPEREKGQPKYAYLPFGAGPRVCIGNTFAMMEAQLILATIAQHFDWSFDPAQRVAFDPQLTLGPKYGMRMKLARRHPLADSRQVADSALALG